MPKPQSRRALAAMMGFEPGSVMAGLSTARQKEFRAWLAAFNRDAGVYEAQLADRRFVRPHRPAGVDKVTEVSKLYRFKAPIERIIAEMEKCDVVCANCHRIRTVERGRWGQ